MNKKRGRPFGPRQTVYIILGLENYKIQMHSVIATSKEQAFNKFVEKNGIVKQILGPFFSTNPKSEDLLISVMDEIVFGSYVGSGSNSGQNGYFFEIVGKQELVFFSRCRR